MATKKTKLIATDSMMIDPTNAGSTISYVVTQYGDNKEPTGELHMSDCERRIKWYFGRYTDPKKLDKAIQMLQEFRDKLSAAKVAKPKRARKPVEHAKLV